MNPRSWTCSSLTCKVGPLVAYHLSDMHKVSLQAVEDRGAALARIVLQSKSTVLQLATLRQPRPALHPPFSPRGRYRGWRPRHTQETQRTPRDRLESDCASRGIVGERGGRPEHGRQTARSTGLRPSDSNWPGDSGFEGQELHRRPRLHSMRSFDEKP